MFLDPALITWGHTSQGQKVCRADYEHNEEYLREKEKEAKIAGTIMGWAEGYGRLPHAAEPRLVDNLSDTDFTFTSLLYVFIVQHARETALVITVCVCVCLNH